MSNLNFMQFMQMLQAANPQMGVNNPNFFFNNNPNMVMNNMMINMMLQMMGLNGANPNNLISIFNQPQQPQPQTFQGYINLIFMQKMKHIRVIIQADYKESIGSVVNKYITKSGDANINLYIVNGRRLDESMTVGQAGLIDNSLIDVVSTDDVEGAKI